ncbi:MULTISPECIES: apolipoprotein N-acyltransferase [Streptomyces]|uniref:Apolipoprotein N-acyltransferase n=1 Tax=Streptomyces venezuelae (strain ATCC 10712 / CBS 650.69 / DSM 40230 / JCM 4526 / NBRC 13096 / PD 04745) TaxID=953739 RepID=F2R8P6_STRVP|nr:apolipoprotein N-acyltransferase [Streptomyces venezuelae]APE20113.1 apolipoprotein N-acyltransferase [Streptomyces venezuelae]QER97514.1 apolipoprotein N-acyltransferase [Streptomyces venezuelae ATCC 10712]CCA53964.1 putative polyprenol-phosphate-mannosyl transferase [Streptomyces venezuelae ATCC 10712]
MSATITPVDASGPDTAPPPGLRLRRFVRPGAALLSGFLLYLSFPPRPLWWLALPAFALLGWTLRGRRPRAGFGLGYLAGLGFLLPLLVWTGEEVGAVPWLALAAVEALFVAAAGLGIAAVSRLPWWPVFAAGVWILAEAARARVPFGGFPWGKIAFGQADGIFLPLAAVGGTPVLGFAVALCGFGLYETYRQIQLRRAARTSPSEDTVDTDTDTDTDAGTVAVGTRPRPHPRGPLVAAALAVLVPVTGALAALPLVDDAAEDGTATVAAVQGNVPRLGLDFNSQRRAVLDNHAARTRELAEDVKAGREPQPDFVLWPENSSDIDPYANADAADVIDGAVRAIGVPTVIGAVVAPETGKLRNTLIEWDPRKGPVATYDKRHVQPFGEYIPMRSFVRLFNSNVDRVSRDFGAGTKVGVFDLAGTKVGLATCYEAAFDWAVRDTVTHGAQLITVPSNNATFGRSEMTYQQLAMSRVRAVEHSRSVVVPVTSGVSAVIRPDGEIVAETKMFTPDVLVEKVPLRSSLTPATRMGTLPEALLVALAAAGLGWSALRSVRARRARTE